MDSRNGSTSKQQLLIRKGCFLCNSNRPGIFVSAFALPHPTPSLRVASCLGTRPRATRLPPRPLCQVQFLHRAALRGSVKFLAYARTVGTCGFAAIVGELLVAGAIIDRGSKEKELVAA